MSLRLEARIAILIACGLFSFAAQAKSSKLHHYVMNECTKKFCVRAEGEEAFVSVLEPIISASEVKLELNSKPYDCVSFAYYLNSSTLTCETKTKTIVVDLASSDITQF
jgi:hypothetical protein